jgi:hypothetical protein
MACGLVYPGMAQWRKKRKFESDEEMTNFSNDEFSE